MADSGNRPRKLVPFNTKCTESKMMKMMKLFTVLGIVAMMGASATVRADDGMPSTKAGTAQTIRTQLQDLGSPAKILDNGVFGRRNLNGYTYWITKALFYDWTVGGVNYGEMIKAVVVAPDANWCVFWDLDELQLFLRTGDRNMLQIPNLGIEQEERAEQQQQRNSKDGLRSRATGANKEELEVCATVRSQAVPGAPQTDEQLKAVEQDLNDLWQTLSPQKQAALRPEQREWVKYKDSLPPTERVAEIERRVRGLWPNINVPPGGLEVGRVDVYGNRAEPTSAAELQIRQRWQQRAALQRQSSFKQELEQYGITEADIQKFNATPLQDRRKAHIHQGVSIPLVGSGMVLGPGRDSRTGEEMGMDGYLLKDDRGMGKRSLIVIGGGPTGAPVAVAKVNSTDFDVDEE